MSKTNENNVALVATFTSQATKRIFKHFEKYGGIIGYDFCRTGRDKNMNPIKMASLNTYKDKLTPRDAIGSKNEFAKIKVKGNKKILENTLGLEPSGIMVANGIDGIEEKACDSDLIKACELLSTSGRKLQIEAVWEGDKWHVQFSTLAVNRRKR
jgi:hypothetical protein